jgi:oxygen-independent coproporphyrinogen-3 oxidase
MMKGVERQKRVPNHAAFGDKEEVGVYIQVPFCQTKCTYCNFHTGVASPSAYAPYARAVEREIRNWRSLHAAAHLESAQRFSPSDMSKNCHSEERRLSAGATRNPSSAFSYCPPPRAVIPNPAPGSPTRAGLACVGVVAAPLADVGEESTFADSGEGDRPVAVANTIYLGGGTPSLFDPADLARILDAVRSQFAPAPVVIPNPGRISDGGEGSAFSAGSVSARSDSTTEVTLEADPETITPEKAAAWLAAGVNRISLGTQSFHDAELKAAGRMHRREDIFSAIACLRSKGFANISLDLIAGLPYQTPASWLDSLDETLRLRPEHISIYLFEIDEGSRLGRELLAGGARYSAASVPSDDAMADSYEFACERLRHAGYDHYEISNWALPGFRSRHNLKYWRREPYLGFGAGAHSFDGHWRWANAHDPAAYAAAIESGRLPVEQLEEVTPKQALDEELFLGLRQLDGIDLAPIAAQYGAQQQAQYNKLGARIEELRAQGLVECDGTRVRLAPARLAVSNEVFVALLD